MADPVSTALSLAQIIIPSVEPVIRRLIEERRERSQMEKGLEKEIQRLFSNMQALKDLLHDADKKQYQSAALRGWLMSLKEVVSDADDVLDEYATDFAISQMEGGSQLLNPDGWRVKVGRSLACCFTSQPDTASPVKINKLKFVEYIENINTNLDDLYKRRSDLGLQVLSESHENLQSYSNTLGWRKTTSVPDHFQLEGREEVKREIIEKLVHQLGKQGEKSSAHNNKISHISIIPVVGMGGLGKTTLARSIFNDDGVKFHFGDLRAWVCVSENFDVVSLTKIIIESIYHSQRKGQTCQLNDLENLQNELLSLIEGKQFLLILDDVWTESTSFWDLLLKPIRATKSGCQCVIYTTRIANIRNAIGGCIDNVVLKGLKDEHVWKLFCMHAFDGQDENDNTYRQLESIGKTFITRLKGSPLAAKSIGRLLTTNYNPKYWRDVSKSDLLNIGQGNDDIFSILFLSYQHLPSHLKQCLMYFSLFPKGYTFRESDMIPLWMANGCIHKHRGMSLEDAGMMYFKSLVDRSFLEFRHGFGSYSMHDLVHDMVQSISEHDCYWLHDNKKINEKNHIRYPHMSFIGAKDDSFINEMCHDNSKFDRTRTMIYNGYPKFQKIYDMAECLFRTMINLRALVIKNCNLVVLPDSIYNLKHLRLLDISNTKVQFLSESLGNLYNLRVLNLAGCLIRSLPNNTSRLVNLRYIIVKFHILSAFKSIGRLRELRSSIIFTIQDEDGFHISELKDMNFLNGILEIENLQLVRRKEDALDAQIEKKEDLKCLALRWRDIKNDEIHEEDIIEALKPCKGLVEVHICGYKGINLPSWLNESWLGSLVVLKMINCNKLEKMPIVGAWLNSLHILKLVSCTKLQNLSPHLGKMQLLRELHLKSLHGLKEIRWQIESPEGRQCYLFKSLVVLAFEDLLEWTEWCVNGVEEDKLEGMIIFPRLETLCIDGCPKLNCVDVPLLGMILKFPNKCRVGASTSVGNDVDVSMLTPHHVPDGLTSLQMVQIMNCFHIISCDLLPTMTSLEHLRIVNCQSLTCLHLSTSVISLKKLLVEQCPKLESCTLSSQSIDFKRLSIESKDGGMLLWLGKTYIEFPATPTFYPVSSPPPNLVGANSELCGLLFGLPDVIESLSLINLEMKEMRQLLTQINACSMLHLTRLTIAGCSDLEHIEGHDGIQLALPNLTASLAHLNLSECGNLKSFLMLSQTLEIVELKSCPLLPTSLDLCGLTSLKRFGVHGCPSAASLLFPPSISMDKLTIESCPNLRHLSPASLSSFTLINCNREQVTTLLQQIQPAHLKKLCVSECSDLEHFEGPTFLSFTSLRELEIKRCKKLESLPSDLSTRLLLLEDISISYCSLLTSLPDMRPLASLGRLYVLRCPKLTKKYKNSIQLQAFSHIPVVYIGDSETYKCERKN